VNVRNPTRFLAAEEVEQGIDRAAHGQEARQPPTGAQ